MKITNNDLKRIHNEVVPQVIERFKSTGEPVALNQLPCWGTMRANVRRRRGRAFSHLIKVGKVEGIKYVGKGKYNHSTYAKISSSGGGWIINFIRLRFGQSS